jgi:hypothetical protein
LHAPCVRPGRYEVKAHHRETRGDLAEGLGLEVDVSAGKETVLDLRRIWPRFLTDVPSIWVNLTVSSGGRPVSGAVVVVFTKEKHKPKDGTVEDLLVRVAADLSDDDGRVRFRAIPGRRYVAVGRVAGRLVGRRSFAAAPDEVVSVQLARARTLVVRLNEWERPEEGEMDETLALFYALGLVRIWRYDFERPPHSIDARTEALGRLDRDGPFSFVAEDLPVGRDYEVMVQSCHNDEILAEETVAITAEETSVQELYIHTGPAPN